MTPITQPETADRYRRLAAEMMLPRDSDRCEFNPVWIRSQGWKVVPAEQGGGHFVLTEISRIVLALNQAGYDSCIAIATEPLDDQMPDCYALHISEGDFRDFNGELGPFRFLLMGEQRSWAISCTEWYNLFAGPLELVESMMGKTVDQARQDYLAFALEIATQPDEPLVKMAEHYCSL